MKICSPIRLFFILMILFIFVGCSEDSDEVVLTPPEVISISPPVSSYIMANTLFTIEWNVEVKPNSGLITLGGKTGKVVEHRAQKIQWKTDTPFDRPEDGVHELIISGFLSLWGIIQKEDFKGYYTISTPCEGSEPEVVSVVPDSFSFSNDRYIDAIQILGQDINPDELRDGMILEIDEPITVRDFSAVEKEINENKEVPIQLEYSPKEEEKPSNIIRISSFNLKFNKKYIISFIIGDSVYNTMSTKIDFTTPPKFSNLGKSLLAGKKINKKRQE